VEQEREKHEDDRGYIPVPPTMALVQQAFNKTPNSASPEEHEAVRFFYKMCVATLDPIVTSDATCGATVMQALDTKMERMQKEQEGVAGNKKKKKWENHQILGQSLWQQLPCSWTQRRAHLTLLV
jgi:hypothetical protein